MVLSTRFKLLVAGLLGLVCATPPPPVIDKELMIISEFDTGPTPGAEYQVARDLGYNITSKTKAQFQAMTVDELGYYNAIVISDKSGFSGQGCDETELSFLDLATSTKLATAAKGNIFIMGTSLTTELNYMVECDIDDHTPVTSVARDALHWVSNGTSTGFYLSFSCYRSNRGSPATSVPELAGFGNFTSRSGDYVAGSGCIRDVELPNANEIFQPDVNASTIDEYYCPIAEVFVTWPAGFAVSGNSASAQDDAGVNMHLPFMLNRMSIYSNCGNGRVDGPNWKEDCDDGEANAGGTSATPYSTCSAQCKCIYGVAAGGNCNPVPNICGNGVWESGNGEQCDDGPSGSETCSSTCQCIYGVGSQPGTCRNQPVCGNGVVEDGEQCEPRGQPGRRDPSVLSARRPVPIPDDICNSQCQCIYGLNATTAACNPVPVCGNYWKQQGEECDAGSTGDEVCSSACRCIYGATQDGCAPAPVDNSTTTTAPPTSTATRSSAGSSSTASAPSTPATSSSVVTSSAPTTSPTSAPFSTVPTSSVPTSSATPTQTSDPLPPRLSTNYELVGCTGSELNYPSFTLQVSSDKMNLEMCTAACNGRLYAGVHVNNCYCSDQFNNVVTISRAFCNLPCPGNPAENCGGYRSVNSTTTFVRRQHRRQAAGPVPSNALLAVYQFAPQSPTSTVPAPTSSVPGASSVQPAPQSQSQSQSQSTATATAVVTATATATATATSAICSSGYCNTAGYVFEQCQGYPSPGEVVFVLQACSCPGGWQYVPAGCDGTSCGSLVVYRAVAWTAGTAPPSGVVLYQPQACISSNCAGSIIFVQGSGGNGNTTSPAQPSTFVVAAEAGKIAGYMSSLVVAVGTLVLLF